MSGPDWCRWYPSKWATGVIGLTPEQRGVYIDIISRILDGKEVPTDWKWLGKLCNCNAQRVRRIVGELILAGKLEQTSGKLHQNRAESERNLAMKLAKTGADLARERWHGTGKVGPHLEESSSKLGANLAQTSSKLPTNLETTGADLERERWKDKGLADAAQQCKPQPQPDSNGRESSSESSLPDSQESLPLESRAPNGATSSKKRGSRLPDDWEPSEQALEHCRDKLGCPDDKLQQEYEAFMDWGLSATGQHAVKLDWDRTFIGWIRRELKRVQERQETERRWAERRGQTH